MPSKKSQIEQSPEGSAVQSVTTATPSADDEAIGQGPGDAKGEQPPLRTMRPDVPIAHSLAAGAGAHVPAED